MNRAIDSPSKWCLAVSLTRESQEEGDNHPLSKPWEHTDSLRLPAHHSEMLEPIGIPSPFYIYPPGEQQLSGLVSSLVGWSQPASWKEMNALFSHSWPSSITWSRSTRAVIIDHHSYSITPIMLSGLLAHRPEETKAKRRCSELPGNLYSSLLQGPPMEIRVSESNGE